MAKRTRKTASERITLTEEEWKGMKPIAEVMPASFIAEMEAHQKRGRGRPKQAVTKQLISLRLEPETVKAYRETGPGWHGRIDDDLSSAARTLSASREVLRVTAREELASVTKYLKPASPKIQALFTVPINHLKDVEQFWLKVKLATPETSEERWLRNAAMHLAITISSIRSLRTTVDAAGGPARVTTL